MARDIGTAFESLDADGRERQDDCSVGALRCVGFGPAAGNPSAPGESDDCRENRSADDTPKGRLRFDWNLHCKALKGIAKNGDRRTQPVCSGQDLQT